MRRRAGIVEQGAETGEDHELRGHQAGGGDAGVAPKPAIGEANRKQKRGGEISAGETGPDDIHRNEALRQEHRPGGEQDDGDAQNVGANEKLAHYSGDFQKEPVL